MATDDEDDADDADELRGMIERVLLESASSVSAAVICESGG